MCKAVKTTPISRFQHRHWRMMYVCMYVRTCVCGRFCGCTDPSPLLSHMVHFGGLQSLHLLLCCSYWPLQPSTAGQPGTNEDYTSNKWQWSTTTSNMKVHKRSERSLRSQKAMVAQSWHGVRNHSAFFLRYNIHVTLIKLLDSALTRASYTGVNSYLFSSQNELIWRSKFWIF